MSSGNPFRSSESSRMVGRVEAVACQVLGKGGGQVARRFMRKNKIRPPGESCGSSLLGVNESEEKRELKKMEKRQQEAIALAEFFGEMISVPALPKEVTPERMEKWEKMGFDLHYLPKINMLEADGAPKAFPGWEDPPNYGRLGLDGPPPQHMSTLPGCWVLVDKRTLPSVVTAADRGLMAHDPLEPVIEGLRTRQIIETYDPIQSRFNFSQEELSNACVMEEFAATLDVPFASLSLPSIMEYNVLGSLYYPEWGTTASNEWFDDRIRGRSRRLFGGSVERGGRRYIGYTSETGDKFPYIGFRLLVRFPS